MVGLEIQVQVSGEKRHEFLQAWKFLTKNKDLGPACLGQYLYENTEEINSFLWVSCWTDANEMERHLTSDRFRTIIGAMDVLGEQSKLRRVYWDHYG